MEIQKDISKPAQLLLAIDKLSQEKTVSRPYVSEYWLNTREIAEFCDLTIYKARYLLLKMAAEGQVEMLPHRVKNSLNWRVNKNKTPVQN
jgi:hypothetical protein